MKNKLIFLFITLLAQTTYSQNTFQKTINRTDYDVGYSVQQTSFGGYVLGGHTRGDNDIYLLAVADENGDTIFTKSFADYCNFDDVSLYAIQSSDNNYVLGPAYYILNVDTIRFCLIKTDTEGNEIWAKTYSNNGLNCLGTHFIETSDNGFIIVGSSNNQLYIIKTDSEGIKEWDKLIPETGYAAATSVTETETGFVITGYSDLYSSWKYFILKLDNEQNVEWYKDYPNAFSEQLLPLSVIKTSDGGFLMTSCTNTDNYIGAYLLKTDANGDTLWTKAYDETYYSYFHSSIETETGNYISVGETGDVNDEPQFYLIETTTNGTFVRKQIITSNEYCTGATNITKTEDNSYIITGYKQNLSTYDWDVLLIKTGPDGIISLKNNPKIKYIINVYPNPADNYININLPKVYKRINVTLTDISGKEAYRKDYTAKKEIMLNLQGLKESFYLIKIETEDYTETQKIIIN